MKSYLIKARGSERINCETGSVCRGKAMLRRMASKPYGKRLPGMTITFDIYNVTGRYPDAWLKVGAKIPLPVVETFAITVKAVA